MKQAQGLQAWVGAGLSPVSWRLDATSTQTLELEGLGEGQADSARFSRVKLRPGQARPEEHARWVLLLLRMGLEGRAQQRTQVPSISLWHSISLPFPVGNQRPGSAMGGASSGEAPTRWGCGGQISDTAPPTIPWTRAMKYHGFWDFPHLPRTPKA